MSQNNSGKPKADATQSSTEKRNKSVRAPKGANTPTHSRFGSQLMAIEQRMLFDGAFAVTADAIRPQTKEMADSYAERAISVGGFGVAGSATVVPRELVVIDSTVANWQQIANAANPNTQLLILDAQQDGLAQIANAMAGGTFSSVHIVSHGNDGKLVLGNRAVTASNLNDYTADLQKIGQSLTDSGDILLYGCEIAKGIEGANFLQALARATNADIAGSTNDTGGTAAGGDWILEARTGSIEAGLAIDSAVAASYAGLLVDAAPKATLGAATTATGEANKVLLGEAFTMNVNFDNTDVAQTGYGPYVDVFYSAKGADGGDGLSISGATYLGSPLTVTQITLTAADIAAGNVTHPYFTDTAGGTKVSIAAGYVAGDKLMVVQLPFGSFTAGQPAVDIKLSGVLSNLADLTGGPALSVTARAGFRYGNDAVANPSTDPSIQQSAASTVTQTITPQLYRVKTTYIGPENETATGINYQRAYRVDVDIAEGQTLTNLQLQEALPDTLRYTAIVGTPTTITNYAIGSSPTGAWQNVNGVLVSSNATGVSGPSGVVNRDFTSVTGTAGAIDASMVVQFYVPEFDSAAALVLNAVSGDDRLATTVVTVQAGGWNKLAGANDSSVAPVTTDANVPKLNEQSISTQKSRVNLTNPGAANVLPADKLEYSVDIQISDYFAFGGSTGNPLQIFDTLSDGLAFDVGSPPVLSFSRADGTNQSVNLLATDYVVAITATGTQTILVDVKAILARVGASEVLVGDQFAADNTQSRAMTAKLVFRADVLDTYRFGAPDDNGDAGTPVPSPFLNEGDRLINRVTVSGTVLDAALDPTLAGLLGEADTSSVKDSIVINAIDIALTSVNANAVIPGPVVNVTPGDAVTYRVRYTVPTGDYQNFNMSAFLPQPVYSVTDPDSNTATPNVTQFINAGSAAGVANPTPVAGTYTYRATRVSDGVNVTSSVNISGAPVDGGANGITFNLGNRDALDNEAITIEIFFTAKTSAAPFADGLFLTAASQATNENTALQPQSSQSIVQFNLTEPVLKIYKAAVQDDVTGSTVFNRAFPATDPSGLFKEAGDAASNPLSGIALTSAQLRAAGDLTNTLVNVDAGDTVRYAIVIENTGSSACGAYDIKIRDTLPAGINFADIVAGSLKVVRGDGVVLLAGVDYTGDLTTLFGSAGIEFIDKVDPTHPMGLGAARGVLADGTVINGSPGGNLLIVTYDVKLPSALGPAAVQAATTYSSNAEIFNYTGGNGLIDPALNFAAAPISDAGSISTPIPALSKTVVTTSESFTSGTLVVIGEVVTFEVVLTIPEGLSNNARFVDTLDPGLAFVDVVSVTSSAGLAVPSTASTFGASANTLSINFGNITNVLSNSNGTAETITIRYRAVATDVAVNQAGQTDNNVASLTVADASGVDRNSTATSSVTIVEPSLSITKVADKTSVQIGETVKYTITVTNNNVAGSVQANDVNFSDLVPAGMTFAGFVGSPVGLSQAGGVITGTNLSGAASGYLSPGESFTFMYTVTVDNTASLGQTFNNNAQVDWSSLPGTANNNTSPLIAVADTERTGAGGVDDYTSSAGAPVTVLGTTVALTIVQTSEAATGSGSTALPVPASPGNAENVNVAPGEIVRYRMIVQLPEANASNASIAAALPPGLRFLNDNTTKIGFVANSAMTHGAVAGGDINGGGTNLGSISALTPSQMLAAAQITGGTGGGGVFISGDDVTFAIGNLTNNDNDTDNEFIVIEFNAVVDNAATQVVRDAQLAANFTFVANAVTQATSDTDIVKVVEPDINNLAKTVAVTGSVATFTTSFTNTGNSIADSVRVQDSFASYPNITFGALSSVKVNGTTVAVTNSGTGIDFVLATPLQVGDVVTVVYTGNITDLKLPVPAQDAVVTYTSLTPAGTSLAGSSTTGERTGDTTNYGTTLNTYRDIAGVGLGVVSGRLWDDTPTYGTGPVNNLFDTGERTFGNVTINLRDVGTGNIIATTFTAADGTYNFGGVVPGSYKVEVATPTITDPVSGLVKIHYDTGGGNMVQVSDGVIDVMVASGSNIIDRNFGYVQTNQAPVVTVPANDTITEDTVLKFDGGAGVTSAGIISFSDEVQNVFDGNMASLSVTNGTLNLASSYVLPANVTVTGQGTAAIMVTGTIANINLVTAQLQFTPTLNFNGNAVLTARIDDKGAQGDGNGDCIPNDPILDNLFDVKTMTINVSAINDAPQAQPDVKFMAGGDAPTSGNAISGVGNQAAGGAPAAIDTDVDGPSIAVNSVMSSTLIPVMTAISPGNPATILGNYGTLTLDSAGNYTYTQDAAKVATLNLSAGSVQDVFKYVITDGSLTANSTITINIGVTNAAPVANPDVNATVEGATTPVTGNAITKPPGVNNDLTDTDPTVGGPALLIQGASVGNVVSGPALTTGLGTLNGSYGTLTLNATGGYSYQVNNANPAVIALNPASAPIKDVFTYTVTDSQGGTSNTTITINITGINNPPVAVDDVKSILANQTISNGQAIAGGVPGDNADIDPDTADAGLLTICGVEAGNKTVVGSTGIGVPIVGTYGTLTLAANGSYTYVPNAAAAALAQGATAVDVFSYCLQDPATAKDVGLITINLTGVNEPPTANPEKFQLNKASPPKSGNAITGLLPGERADTDPDRTPGPDVLTVQGVNVGTPAGPILGRVNTPVVGTYGTLVLMADGSYTYTLDPVKTAPIAKTDNVTDVFTYTINDGHGGVSTTTITFDISGANQPPAGADKLIPLTEDTPRPLTPADFGFTDPDVGDTFKAVRIVSLPDPAGGKLFFNGTEVVLVGGFLQIPFADIAKLEFRPAPNVNTANLATPPRFDFQVCDNDGAFDPTPNRITFSLIPANDPPVASQSVFGMDASATGTALKLDNAQLLSGIKPLVTDPDRPADVLTVMIDVVPPASQGQYFVGTSLVPLKAGDVLTEAQLQQLCFKPNPAISGTPGVDGRIPTQPLMFTVMDGKGGQDATGTIQVNVRPAPALPPVVVPPVVITPPTLPPVVLAPLLPITTRAVNEAAKLRLADDIRFSPIEAASDLDAGGYFDGGRINSVWNRERVAGVQVVAEEAPKSPVKEIDCAPIKPKEKPKLKVVKRSVFADGVKDAPNKNFSEQLKAAQKRFKAPVRTVPKPEIRKDC